MPVSQMPTTRLPSPTLADDMRWEAVARRDASSRGAFVFGVTSTGVYCRPGCAARSPLRRNVRFFATPEEAELAGFRACRRCHPRNDHDAFAATLARVCRHIASHLDERLTLAHLGRIAGMSGFHLQKRFKASMGITPRAYADALRLGVLKQELREGRSVVDAVFEAGYGSTSRAYERTPTHLGMTPSTYRSGGMRQEIRYAIEPTPIGAVLIAATAIGVCAIRLGEHRDALEAGLRDEFPNATLVEDPAALSKARHVVRATAAGRDDAGALPLDVAATAFQHQVWTALRHIPAGETRSYAEIARSVGRPTAVRAVARACAANPVALVIPCHRVVCADGRMGGYRWGADRKAALLAAEGATAPQGKAAGTDGKRAGDVLSSADDSLRTPLREQPAMGRVKARQ